jgi:hypothetical protein
MFDGVVFPHTEPLVITDNQPNTVKSELIYALSLIPGEGLGGLAVP